MNEAFALVKNTFLISWVQNFNAYVYRQVKKIQSYSEAEYQMSNQTIYLSLVHLRLSAIKQILLNNAYRQRNKKFTRSSPSTRDSQ